MAYVSADFREHAVAYLIAGLFERHDRSRFEITAVSIGPDDKSAMRNRIQAAAEYFVDAWRTHEKDIAALVRQREIDVVVDLNGYTEYNRIGIFSRRPAPIQVNYLGYPGTLGAECMDYIMADRILIPEDRSEFYLEKLAALPDSYQMNDDKRVISDRVFTRAELGLPETGFVFCCFNNSHKITPQMFDCWMRILKQVDSSVLWFLETNATIAGNLKKEAVARGVDARRLVFAKRMPLHDHLARHRLADLFLDTLPYNAHTTASDALWAGLPVITCMGQSFAGRVAASLLNAIPLPELITTTLEAYEALAVAVATRHDELEDIKGKLAHRRLTAPLFDTEKTARHIEAAYVAMVARHQAGLAPGHIDVPRTATMPP